MAAELELIGIECEKKAIDFVDKVSLVVDADNHHMEEGRPIGGHKGWTMAMLELYPGAGNLTIG